MIRALQGLVKAFHKCKPFASNNPFKKFADVTTSFYNQEEYEGYAFIKKILKEY